MIRTAISKQNREYSSDKMKSAKIQIPLFLAIILIILAVSGCGPQSTVMEVRIHEGTEGLQMTFLEKSPPDTVYSGDGFPVTVELRNKGATDIESNKGLIVLGAEREYVEVPPEFIDSPIRFTLNGRSLYNPIGGIDRRTINLKAGNLGPQMEVITSTIAITACYPYKTEATAQVCVDSDIYNERVQEKVCTPQTLSMGTISVEGQELPRGQGAPIAITKIEQTMVSHDSENLIKPTYVIHIKNMGEGLPVEIGSYEKACSGTGIEKRTLNVVRANVYLSDRGTQLDCKPKLDSSSPNLAGHVKLEKEEDTIRCELKQGVPKSLGTFTTPLIIDLDYGYTFTISKPVMIKKQV